ncbi:MAG: helix-turn-helix transcriptional regulator, partial [Sphingobium sp.]
MKAIKGQRAAARKSADYGIAPERTFPSGGRTESTPHRSLSSGEYRKIIFDPFRLLVFPNAIREQRRRKGWDSLLTLAASLPDIPYIRLSKIERGEVVAKAAELRAIAEVLGVDAHALLVDVDAPNFSIPL